jgi:asparagine synthase (glutamine-hydrolysing)
MCGITGIVLREPEAGIGESLRRMTEVIRHRGPDDEGYALGNCAGGFVQSAAGADSIPEAGAAFPDIAGLAGTAFSFGLGHRRLSIIDPTPSGHQPMGAFDGRSWITFNGEIYIFREMKKDLEAAGYPFRTRSDTEVLLAAYDRNGPDFVRRLNGIFAFILWDSRGRRFFAARDHFGVKPFYYYMDSRRFVAASEIKAILQVPGVPAELDPRGLDDYLTFRYTPSPNTLLEGIKKLPPGHSLTLDPVRWTLEIRRFHDAPPEKPERRSTAEWTERFSGALERAVRRQMISDVPLGVLLSGGVDSSCVTAIAASATSVPVRTYTVGFEEGYRGNEFREARETAALFGTDHTEVVIGSREFLDFMPEAAWFMDEPMGSSSSIAMYYLCRRAARDIKVALTGQGADEPLAGYDRYKAEKAARWIGPIAGNPVLRRIIEKLPRNEQLKRAARSLGERDWKRRFLRMYALFNDDQKAALVRPEARVAGGRGAEYLDYWAAGAGDLDHLNKMLFIDTRMWLVDDLLNYGDKMSMAASLEARVPLLDLDLVDLIESMPESLKLRGWTRGKYIHKRAAREWLPASIVERPKKGFLTPIDVWFQKEITGEISSILLAPDGFCARYFSVPFIESMIRRHGSRQEDFNRQLFALLFFEFWARRFLK